MREISQTNMEIEGKTEQQSAVPTANPAMADSTSPNQSGSKTRAGSRGKRLDAVMDEEDYQTLLDLKEKTRSKSLIDVIRHALRVLYMLVEDIENGYDIYLIKRGDPSDKVRVKIT